MKVYRGADGDLKPVEMECKVFGYLYCTNTGERMSFSTHFKTKKEAWENILMSVDEGVELAWREVEEAKESLRIAQNNFDKAELKVLEAYKNHGYSIMFCRGTSE